MKSLVWDRLGSKSGVSSSHLRDSEGSLFSSRKSYCAEDQSTKKRTKILVLRGVKDSFYKCGWLPEQQENMKRQQEVLAGPQRQLLYLSFLSRLGLEAPC